VTHRWIIHSRASFDAVHALTSYRGAPEVPHSHRWQVAIRVGATGLKPEGYALDFHEVHALLEETIAPLAGADLGRHPEIGHPSPSAERVAEVIAGELEAELAAIGGALLQVSVWEGPDNRVDLVLDSDQ
jgi:6-pyruvoyl-tetrahydropterin synthase